RAEPDRACDVVERGLTPLVLDQVRDGALDARVLRALLQYICFRHRPVLRRGPHVSARPRSWVTPRGSTRFLRSVPLRGWRRLGQADDLEQCQRIRRRGEAWTQDIVEAHLRPVRSPLDVLGEVHERRTP